MVLVAAAGAAYFFLFSGSGEAEAAAPEHGGYVALEPIAVNLAGGGYLKIGITLEFTDGRRRRRPRRRRRRRLQGHRPDHLDVLAGRTRPT